MRQLLVIARLLAACDLAPDNTPPPTRDGGSIVNEFRRADGKTDLFVVRA